MFDNVSCFLTTLTSFWRAAVFNYVRTYKHPQQGLMKTLKWEKAMDLFRGMRYNNVKPDLMTFNTLMAGLNKARVPTM